jgi:hypothetical protein
VEVGAPADLDRLQVRLVGSDWPSQPRTARRDADREASWCGEFDRLKDLLAAASSEVVVERAICGRNGRSAASSLSGLLISIITRDRGSRRDRRGRMTAVR